MVPQKTQYQLPALCLYSHNSKGPKSTSNYIDFGNRAQNSSSKVAGLFATLTSFDSSIIQED